MTNVDTRDLFFDQGGNKITATQWRALGRERLGLALSFVGGMRVACEYSGINHNPDPNGVPLIYEVTVAEPGVGLAFSWWAASERAALWKYRATLWLACLGGAMVWRRSLRKGRA